MNFKLVSWPQINNIRHLLPEHVFCGSDEILPGIEGKYLPS